jgi:arylformamidase
MHFLARAFTARGIHFASIGYPLAPGAGLGKIVEDCRSATLWLYRQAERRHIDRARVSVLGHSAAGQLCTMVAAADWPALAPGLPAQILHRVIGASGFYDIEPFALTHFHDFTRFAPEDYRAWNPLRHVTPRLPAMSLLTGAAESSLLQQMMEHYARAVMEAGVPVETHATAGECHFSVLHQIGRPASPLFQRVLAAIQ